MVKISRIENSLLSINDAAFQELCNKFLKYKYDYKSIIQTGSVIGKEKTRKGTPDTIFIDKDNNFVFVEYTTQKRVGKSKSFEKKIQDDILKCFDTSKTKINNSKISKIIICHLEKLKLNEVVHFTSLCTDHNPNCIFEQYGIDDLSIELESYPSLLSTYLDISIDSGQLMNLKEYIQFYEKPELRLSTPIGNIFYGRENELMDGMNKLKECSLLLITGSSGVGKTRFSIELCERFKDENRSYTIVCLANNGNNVYNDLQTHFVTIGDYIIIVDDANRAMANFKFILYLLSQQRRGKIKIVVTVRDYAIDLIQNASSEYIYETINLSKVTDEEISTILKSESFNIQNEDYLEKIKRISNGNLRIAIMSAMLAIKEKNLSSLNNISQLYEQYFSEIYLKITEEHEETILKVLGIISFFRVLSKERTEVNARIFSVFNISEDVFWSQCQNLNKKEVVDLYENEVVKISDQILSTYIFYKVFFDLKRLDFSLLIKNFIEFDSNFYDSLNPLLSAYDYINIKGKLADIIESDKELITENKELNQAIKIINIFWFCIEKKTLSFFNKYILNLPNPEVIEFTADYDHNRIVRNVEVDALSILTKFRRLENENSNIALELMFLFVEKVPNQSERLSYFIKENWLIIRNDFYNDFRCQHVLIDFIIKKVKMDLSPLYKVFFYKIASYLLELRFEEHNSSGKNFTFYTIQLQLNDSIKKLRSNIWEFAWSLYEEDPYMFYKLIFDLKYEHYEGSRKLWSFDSKLVIPMLQSLNYNDFNACEALEQYLKYLDWAKVKYDKTIKTKATNSLYLLKKNLTNKDRIRTSAISNRKTAQYKRLSILCSNYTYKDYLQFFKDVGSIYSIQLQTVDLSFSLTAVFEDLAIKDKILFIRVLKYFLNNHKLQVWSLGILNAFFNSKPNNCDDLFNCLQEIKSNRKDNWLSEFHLTILKEFVTSEKQHYLQSFYDMLLQSDISIYRISNIVEKYSVFESEKTIYSKILDIITINSKIRVDELFIINALDLTKDFSKCELIYLRNKLKDRMFDYKHSIFEILLRNDSTFIIRYLNNIPKGIDSENNYSSDRISFIWDMDNHEDIVMLVIDFFNSEKSWYRTKDLLYALFIGINENQRANALTFIENVIRKEYSNSKYMKTIFNIITHSFALKKIDFLKLFLSYNHDFESFKKIDLFPGSMTTSGSWIPVFQKRIEDWEQIQIALQTLKLGVKLLSHLEYIEDEIEGCKRRIKYESKREFMEN